MDFLDTNRLPIFVAALKAAGLAELDFTVPAGHFRLVFSASTSIPVPAPEEESETDSAPAVTTYERLGVKDFG